VATEALPASIEAAGEFVYVRVISMCPGGAAGKVGCSDTEPALGARRAPVGNLAAANEPGEVFLTIAGPLGGLREAQQLDLSMRQRQLHSFSGPLQGAGARVVTKTLAELRRLGADLGEGFADNVH
jgi:hypothetical protein